jgi:hypothetical protein
MVAVRVRTVLGGAGWGVFQANCWQLLANRCRLTVVSITYDADEILWKLLEAVTVSDEFPVGCRHYSQRRPGVVI